MSTGHTDPGLSANPMGALLAGAPDSAANVQQWLQSTFQCPSGHCGIREGAQPHDQQETADASDALKSQDDVSDPVMRIGDPQVERPLGSNSEGDTSSMVSLKTELTHDFSVSHEVPRGGHDCEEQPCTAARERLSVGQQQTESSTPDGTSETRARAGASFPQEEALFQDKAYTALDSWICAPTSKGRTVFGRFTPQVRTRTRGQPLAKRCVVCPARPMIAGGRSGNMPPHCSGTLPIYSGHGRRRAPP